MPKTGSRGPGRPAFQWRALLRSVRFLGSIAGAGAVPRGTVTLHMVLADAGVSSGREVEVVITPDQLDAVYHLVSRARKERDKK